MNIMNRQPTAADVRFKALHPQSREDYIIQDLYNEMGRHSTSSGYLDDVYMQPLLMRFRRLGVSQDEYKAWIRATRQAVLEDRRGSLYGGGYTPNSPRSTSSNTAHRLADTPTLSSASPQSVMIEAPKSAQGVEPKNSTPTSHILLVIAGVVAAAIWIWPQITNNSRRAVEPTPTRIVVAAVPSPTRYVLPTATAYVLPTETPRPLPTNTPVIQRFAPAPPPEPAVGCPNGCEYPPRGCDIKGNISFDSGAKIYHLPYQRYYAATVINPAYGERWFCTEQEAVANGWRRSRE